MGGEIFPSDGEQALAGHLLRLRQAHQLEHHRGDVGLDELGAVLGAFHGDEAPQPGATRFKACMPWLASTRWRVLSLDPLLKGLIVKAAIVVLCALAALLAIPCGILLARKLYRQKPRNTMIIRGSLLTLLLFGVFAYALMSLGFLALNHWVVQPAKKQECVRAMRTISRLGGQWAGIHDGRFPTDFSFLSDDPTMRFIIMCRDGNSDQAAARASYEIVTPGVNAKDAASVFLRCPYHQHLAYTDRTVFDGIRRQ